MVLYPEVIAVKNLFMAHQNSGSALVFALIFSTILAIGIGGYLSFVVGQSRIVKHHSDFGKAFYLAEAGISKAIIELENYASPPGVFPGIEEADLGDGTYLVEESNRTIGQGDMIVYELHSIGVVNDIERELVAEVQTESFAKWSYFSTDESYLIHIWWWWWHWIIEVPVWFTTGSYLEGPVHTNGQFNVSGYPVFNGPVSSASESINYMHGPDQDGITFYSETCGGYDAARDARFEPDELNLGVDAIDTSRLNSNRLQEAASEASEAYDPSDEGRMDFTGDTEITFLEDGTMNVTNSLLEWIDHNVSQPSAILVENGNLTASGRADTSRIHMDHGNLDISGTINTSKIYVDHGNMDISGDINTSEIYLDHGNMDISGNIRTPRVYVDGGNMNISGNIDTTDGAMFVDGGDLQFSGTTVAGTVTVGTDADNNGNYGNVIISDDVIYNTDPRQDPASTDKLGIIAGKNVIIDKDAPQDAAPADPEGVTIHASIIAIDESFTVEQYWSGIREILTVLGGIIQTRRGPVGTFYADPYRKASGYDKNYQYDQRMRYSPPPYFPFTGEYEMVYWKEELDEDEDEE